MAKLNVVLVYNCTGYDLEEFTWKLGTRNIVPYFIKFKYIDVKNV